LEGTTLIYYQGYIRYETIGELIHTFKHEAPRLGIPLSIYKRILLIMIESLENIMKHSEMSDLYSGNGNLPELSIVYKDERYIIQTSNQVGTCHIADLKARIDLLNNLDQQGLKSLYKETITDGVFSKRGGAGLGLIEIAKISSNPINYEFQAVSEDFTIFRQKITVDVKREKLL
jgi:hypothetical protein